jgi:uncharacterized protein YdeI (YjbR/CyaY-like superfamily)
MPAAKPVAKTFQAVLQRPGDRLRWVTVRVPLDVAKTWGQRGQLRIQGEINGFSFRSALFPTRKGEHFLIVNKKMQAGGKTEPGLTAKFRLQPDTAPREEVAPPKEFLRELGQSKRLGKFYESLNPSLQREIPKWIAEARNVETRRRRSQQIAERLMETMEAERELPPIMQLAFRQNPRAHAEWNRVSKSHRGAHLLGIFHYRNPESRARRVAKCVEEHLHRAEKGSVPRKPWP